MRFPARCCSARWGDSPGSTAGVPGKMEPDSPQLAGRQRRPPRPRPRQGPGTRGRQEPGQPWR